MPVSLSASVVDKHYNTVLEYTGSMQIMKGVVPMHHDGKKTNARTVLSGAGTTNTPIYLWEGFDTS